ncbi:MAG: aminoglycoside 6-adenylyltransferase [Oscillospiraceae bacterium]|nr:aminoglycoside 6-adenylyltransferase [Oscillospiraceae bacterium]
MRTEKEMFALFDRISAQDPRIRVMTLEGSRVNPNVTPDVWQDYDLTFLVTDVESFTKDDSWLSLFGDLVFMQKPEAMDLFPPDFPAGWFSYLMLFADGVKIDLTLVPVTDVRTYFAQDPLIRVLLDKDGICPPHPDPTDAPFWVQKPSEAFIRDCSNEFFLSATYAHRALLREEFLFVTWTFENRLHPELLRMLGYLAGGRAEFPVNTGKHDRWIFRYLTEAEGAALRETYRLDSLEGQRLALSAAMELFARAMGEVCAALGFNCPKDPQIIRDHLAHLPRQK